MPGWMEEPVAWVGVCVCYASPRHWPSTCGEVRKGRHTSLDHPGGGPGQHPPVLGSPPVGMTHPGLPGRLWKILRLIRAT